MKSRMLGLSVITLILLMQIELSAQQKNKAQIDKVVINWVEIFFISKGYFSFLTDSTKKSTNLTSKDIEGYYHIFLIEEQDFDSVNVSIYTTGVNISYLIDLILIAKFYKNQENEFIIIGLEPIIDSLTMLCRFFRQYTKFSDHARAESYERLLIDYINSTDTLLY